MCLAVPATVVEREGEFGWVSVGRTRSRVNLLMTPEVEAGDWVLVHAGFAIQSISEEEARATWGVIEEICSQSEEEARR